MNILRVLAGVAGALVLPCGALGQSFNIDIDVEAGGPEVGAGVPSNAFGAAANQPGFWTLLGAAQHTHAYPLFGLDGTATAATVRWNASGGGAGSGWMGNTGDYRLLLNDCTPVTVPTTYHFEGILPGRYKLTTYAVNRSGNSYPTRLTVLGAVMPTKLSGNGSMPGDAFVEGITHCIHEIAVTGTSFSVTAESILARPNYGAVNGFQVTYEAVPEPMPAVVLVLGIGWVVAGRSKR